MLKNGVVRNCKNAAEKVSTQRMSPEKSPQCSPLKDHETEECEKTLRIEIFQALRNSFDSKLPGNHL
eukprot:12402383-Karenia_brevis.AAC.1